MTARPPKEMGLDLPFEEALERFAGVDPKEMNANIAKSKQKKPPGGSKKKRKPPGKDENVLSLRERRMSRRRRGHA